MTRVEKNVRDNLRANLLKSRLRKRVEFKLFDESLELEQPSVGQIMEMPQDNQMDQITHVLINWCYIPGTDQHVFEEGDEQVIRNWPTGTWLENLSKVIEEFSSSDVEENAKK